MIGVITEQYAKPNTHLYDLGCSLGASLLAMRHGVKVADCTVVGIDNAAAMLKRCQSYVDIDDSIVPVELHAGDVTDFEYKPASVITLNFTLQFIPLDKRHALIKKLYDALLPRWGTDFVRKDLFLMNLSKHCNKNCTGTLSERMAIAI